jgi:hypothetical protein
LFTSFDDGRSAIPICAPNYRCNPRNRSHDRIVNFNPIPKATTAPAA